MSGTRAVGSPHPNSYLVESTGTPQVPLGATVDILIDPTDPQHLPFLKIAGTMLGVIDTLPNGDFEVVYRSGGTTFHLQFRQTGACKGYLFGVAISKKADPTSADDPPITGVWGAEARPPQEPDPEG